MMGIVNQKNSFGRKILEPTNKFISKKEFLIPARQLSPRFHCDHTAGFAAGRDPVAWLMRRPDRLLQGD